MVSPYQHKTESCYIPEAVPLITFIPQVAVTEGREYGKRIWLNLLSWRKRSQFWNVPIIWKVANCLGNRKDFKDLINLKSLLFITRLNSNQFVGTQRVCDDSVRCVCVWELQKQSVVKLFHEKQSAELSDVPRSNPKVIQEAVTNPQILN